MFQADDVLNDQYQRVVLGRVFWQKGRIYPRKWIRGLLGHLRSRRKTVFNRYGKCGTSWYPS